MREAELKREEARIRAQVEEKRKEAEQKAKDAVVEQTTQKRRRWDMATPVEKSKPEWPKVDEPASTPKSQWDETPRGSESSSETPRKRSRWDVTPQVTAKKSRWDETPVMAAGVAATPAGNLGLVTPTPGQLAPLTPDGRYLPLGDSISRFS
jgi:splicing factor 3B subunit 1